MPDTLLLSRLRNQHLIDTTRRDPADVVSSLCAMQAQDYPAAKWAVGLRSHGCTDAEVEQAFNDGRILRTHVLRPTWHFVAADDIRWLLALSAPRIHATNAYYYRQSGVDTKTFTRSCAVISRALEDGNALTRAELGEHLSRAKVPASGLKLAYLMMHAELEGVICSGPRRGRQFTYMLLSERAPQAKTLDRDRAVSELARRYFSSHGPATARDFAWWSGLTLKDAQRAIASAAPKLESTSIDNVVYWSHGDIDQRKRTVGALLLPNYDEYLIAYRDRALILDSSRAANIVARSGGAFANFLVLEGCLAGGWSRTIKTNSVLIEVAPYRKLTPAQTRAVKSAAECYGEFLGLPASLQVA